MNDPNEGSVVLFKRYGCPPESAAHRSRRWELGRVVNTFFVDATGRVVEPTFEDAHNLTPWVTIDSEKPEGPSAPTTLTVPLDVDHIDPIVHGTEVRS